MMKEKLTLTTVLSNYLMAAPELENPTWNKWNGLIGEWIDEDSELTGKKGTSFSFKFDLDEKIIVRKSHSEYAEQENVYPTILEDLMIICLDSKQNPSKAFYFDNNGRTIYYYITYTDNSIVLTSTKIQNVPVSRLSFTLIDSETVSVKSEQSEDEKIFITQFERISRKVM